MLAVELGTEEAYETFLARNPTGFFSDLVRAQRARLASTGSQPVVRQAEPQTSAAPAKVPVAFNDYRGQAFELAFHQSTHEMSPRNATWGTARHYSIDVRSDQEIISQATLRSDWNGTVRKFDVTAALSVEGFPKWELREGALAVTYRERDFLMLKIAITRSGNSCAATATFEPIAGRQNYKLNRWGNGEQFTADWIRAEKVTCRLVSDATASRSVRKRR
jgi:hypothetical protein